MNQPELETRLKNLPLGGIRFFQQITSTNDEAAAWVKSGCPDMALVIADQQTEGRGRGGHKWYTPAGSALAFSVIICSKEELRRISEVQNTARLNGLGALAVCQALQSEYQLPAKIKWPNDIIVNGMKLSGVLAEAHWIGDDLRAIVLGIGINVATMSVPPANWDRSNAFPFPATCIESVLGAAVNRWDLLYAVLEAIFTWRDQLSGTEFMDAWQQKLAFQGECVWVHSTRMDLPDKLVKIIGLEDDGALQIHDESGELTSLRVGEIHPSNPSFGGFNLRPVDSSRK